VSRFTAEDGAELAALARAIVDANKYMSLATADASGAPSVSPVYYTPPDYRQFLWVSSPEARHSHNIAVRPKVAIAIYDSTAGFGQAQAVYMDAEAGLVPDGEIEAVASVFSARFDDLTDFTGDMLRAPAPFRLYRALVSEHSVLLRGSDPRNSRGADERVAVDLS
jgi:hypothetical protein